MSYMPRIAEHEANKKMAGPKTTCTFKYIDFHVAATCGRKNITPPTNNCQAIITLTTPY